MKKKTLTTQEIRIICTWHGSCLCGYDVYQNSKCLEWLFLTWEIGFILLFASIVDPLGGFLIGGLGSALADVAGGYAYYFFPTLIIKGLEGGCGILSASQIW